MSKKLESIKEILAEAPISPGVYLMKNRLGKVLYIGKAKNIKNRVKSYFTGAKDISSKTRMLVAYIEDLEFLTTKTELEALLLEASLIKKHKPKFNVRLKDDKSYPYLKVSLEHPFPRLYLSRNVRQDGAEYFGPFISSFAIRETIKFLNQTFMIRDCGDTEMKNRKRPCMTHQIGRCKAPCVGLVSKVEYQGDIKSALQFLKGKNKKLLSDLEKQMKESAKQEMFEQAGRLRDSVKALKHILEKQNVVASDEDGDQDIIGFYGNENGLTIECLHLRQGILLGHQHHHFPLVNIMDSEEDIREALSSFIIQYYENNLIPDELYMPTEMGRDLNILIEKLLTERKGSKVKVCHPVSLKGKDLLKLAFQNAEESFKAQMRKRDERYKGLEEIQRKLQLKAIPHRIECFDISHFQGEATVASQVVFEDGLPSKEHYRRYKIRTVNGVDDFKSMKEVLERRLAHEEYETPDLIVIDGGKGQLKMATMALKEFGRDDIPVCGLAKARTRADFTAGEVDSTEERVFLPGRENPITFYPNSLALHILTGIRDEAHRFAITFHRKVRDKTSLSSVLDDIVGLGAKRKKILMDKFGDVAAIKRARAQDIAELPTFNFVLAERILLHLAGSAFTSENGDENPK
jgi:excinuclease ABC subunit C